MSTAWSIGHEKARIVFRASEQKSFSLRRAILAAADTSFGNCLEREVSQTLQKETGLLGETHSIFVPSSFGKPNLQAALNVMTAGQGKESIATELQSLIELLRARLVILQAGAQFVTDLRGNVAFPRQTAGPTVNWKTESAQSVASDSSFDQVTMSPKKLTAKTSYTMEFLSQSTLGVEAFIRNDIGYQLAKGIDAAGFYGSGVAPIPKGIALQTDIGSIAWDSTKKFEKLVDLESLISGLDADSQAMAYVTTPETRGLLKKTPQLANTINLPIWTGGRLEGEVNGYRAFATNNLPKNLNVLGGNNEHALLFGDFSQCVIGEWGVLEVIVDPFTRADYAEYVINARLLADIAVRHPQAFAVMTGVLVS